MYREISLSVVKINPIFWPFIFLITSGIGWFICSACREYQIETWVYHIMFSFIKTYLGSYHCSP